MQRKYQVIIRHAVTRKYKTEFCSRASDVRATAARLADAWGWRRYTIEAVYAVSALYSE